ncbi:PQQ-binding-like beta-propeller repeat protein [Salana multivorans]|nr:PQQ-binding-like beta-propeller repeat protein [Salana multivorans]
MSTPSPGPSPGPSRGRASGPSREAMRAARGRRTLERNRARRLAADGPDVPDGPGTTPPAHPAARRWPLAVGAGLVLVLGVVAATPGGRAAVAGWFAHRADDLTCGSGFERLDRLGIVHDDPVVPILDPASVAGPPPGLVSALAELGVTVGPVVAALDASVADASPAGHAVVAATGSLRTADPATTVVVHPRLLASVDGADEASDESPGDQLADPVEPPRTWAWRDASYAGYDGVDVVAVVWHDHDAEVVTLDLDTGKMIGCAPVALPDDLPAGSPVLAVTGLPLAGAEVAGEPAPTVVIARTLVQVVRDGHVTGSFELTRAPSSAAVAGDLLLLSDDAGAVTAVSLADGATRWTAPSAGIRVGDASPLGEAGGAGAALVVPVTEPAPALRVLDVATGSVRDVPVALDGDADGTGRPTVLGLSPDLLTTLAPSGGGLVVDVG